MARRSVLLLEVVVCILFRWFLISYKMTLDVFATKFEETTEASPELVRNGDAMSVANTKARYARNSLILLGAGPLFIAVAFADHGRNDHELARPE